MTKATPNEEMTNILDNNITPNFIFTIILHYKRNKISSSDVEQTVHAFLEQQGHRKSQRKIKGGCQ